MLSTESAPDLGEEPPSRLPLLGCEPLQFHEWVEQGDTVTVGPCCDEVVVTSRWECSRCGALAVESWHWNG